VHGALGEALAQTADGRVTPEARAAFAEALRRDPADPRARFYLAGAKAQTGDPRGAIADWQALLRDAPEDAPWLGALRATITATAREAKLPVPPEADPQPPVAPAPPPSAAEAIAGLEPAQRDAAIRAMVDGLAARLATNPRDLAGWERLIRARTVLGDAPGAAQARAAARAAFAGDAPALARIEAA
jgi:cytochrome c-type biogenesis protein CcmH